MIEAPAVVIGAGPIGLAAAAQLAERGIEFTVLEAGPSVAAAIDEWRHVKLFSPWRYDLDPAARRLLERAGGWSEPELSTLPTGGDPIGDHPQPPPQTPPLSRPVPDDAPGIPSPPGGVCPGPTAGARRRARPGPAGARGRT